MSTVIRTEGKATLLLRLSNGKLDTWLLGAPLKQVKYQNTTFTSRGPPSRRDHRDHSILVKLTFSCSLKLSFLQTFRVWMRRLHLQDPTHGHALHSELKAPKRARFLLKSKQIGIENRNEKNPDVIGRFPTLSSFCHSLLKNAQWLNLIYLLSGRETGKKFPTKIRKT